MTKLRLAVAGAQLIGRLHYFQARNGIPVGRIARVRTLDNHACRSPSSHNLRLDNGQKRSTTHSAEVEVLQHIFVPKDAGEVFSLDQNGCHRFARI